MVPRKLWLGNHGSAKNPENVVLEPARPTIPTPSTQSFITPTTTVKTGPSIKNLINDPVPAPTATPNTVITQSPTSAPSAPTEPVQPPVETVAAPDTPETELPAAPKPIVEETVPEVTEKTIDPAPQIDEAATSPVKRPPADPDEDPETFQTFWETMVATVFADVPTLHEPLKHYHPVRKENIIIIPVKNDIQENDFAPRKHQVLAYLRQNWDETLDDIEVKLDLNMETKKYILDDNDKLNALREQNPDIADFIKSLNLRIKNY